MDQTEEQAIARKALDPWTLSVPIPDSWSASSCKCL